MKTIIRLLVLIPVVLAVVLAGCASSTSGEKGPITVGSKIDTEGGLLSQMIILMLEENGFQVIDKSQFGPTDIVRKAIASGELDLYPEYTGNGAFFFGEADSAVWKDAEQGYQRVKELDKDANDIVWLKPAPANNTWAIAIPESLADEQNLASLEDFAGYVNSGGYVKLIGSEEFITSPAALPAFQQAYGFNLAQSQLLAVSSGDTAQTEKAAAEGTDGVNAAMAYGTESLPKVDKIVGPGNIFVTLAKRQVFGVVDIDGLPGPTETLVIADEQANPALVAADLLAQAEHDPLASAILVTPSPVLAEAVQVEIGRQIEELSRSEVIAESLQNQGGGVICANLDEAVELGNLYAPEHLCLHVQDPWMLIGSVRNAGGVFLGEHAYEVLGDYTAGPTHVMPTMGTARFASPLSVRDFTKIISVFGLDSTEAASIGPAAQTLAQAEGLDGHAAAVRRRL